jgi:hypothetical protein
MRRSWHLAADDCDAVMKSESDAQTIVARTEIGSAPGNTNGDLLHSYAAATRVVDSTAANVIAAVYQRRVSRQPIRCAILISNYPVGAQKQNDYGMD